MLAVGGILHGNSRIPSGIHLRYQPGGSAILPNVGVVSSNV